MMLPWDFFCFAILPSFGPWWAGRIQGRDKGLLEPLRGVATFAGEPKNRPLSKELVARLSEGIGLS